MAEYLDVTPIEIRGTSIPCRVSGTGVFYAQLAGTDFRAESRGDLAEQLKAATARKNVAIDLPFTQLTVVHGQYGRIADGRAVGVHAWNGNVIAIIGRQREQLTGYGVEYFTLLSGEEKNLLAALVVANKKAHSDLWAFRNRYKIDLKKRATELVEAELARPAE